MMPQKSEAPSRSKILPLKVKDLLFVNAYMKNGQNGTQAYLSIHPHAKPDSARAEAPRVLAKPCVQEEIARRIAAEGGITRELVTSSLMYALTLANEKKDAAVISSVTMDCAKLAGFLVEKREDVTPPKSEDVQHRLLNAMSALKS